MVHIIYIAVIIIALIYGIAIGRKYEIEKQQKQNDLKELDLSNLRQEIVKKDLNLERLLSSYNRTIEEMQTVKRMFEGSDAMKDAALKQSHERNLYLENIVRQMGLGPAPNTTK